MAFEAMVLKYQPKLMSSLIGYTKSRDQAEELCQKTFIRVWQKIDSFREIAHFLHGFIGLE